MTSRLVSRVSATRRRQRWFGLATCAGLMALAGLVLLSRGASAALWLLFVAALVAHWAARRASDCGVLVALDGVPLQRIATPLTMVAARSVSPLSDVARIRAAGGGAVAVDGDIRLLPLGRVERIDLDMVLSGRWDLLAVVPCELDGTVTADRLRRLPDEDEVWLVRTSSSVRMLCGDRLRAVAAIARRAHDTTASQTPEQAHPTGSSATGRRRRSAPSRGRRRDGGHLPSRR